jgi:hypothetical protein
MSPIDDKNGEKIRYVKVRHNAAAHRAATGLLVRSFTPV